MNSKSHSYALRQSRGSCRLALKRSVTELLVSKKRQRTRTGLRSIMGKIIEKKVLRLKLNEYTHTLCIYALSDLFFYPLPSSPTPMIKHFLSCRLQVYTGVSDHLWSLATHRKPKHLPLKSMTSEGNVKLIAKNMMLLRKPSGLLCLYITFLFFVTATPAWPTKLGFQRELFL